MNSLDKIISFRKIIPRFYIYLLFLVVHLFLFNINSAEWGDSYRILISSEQVREGAYPGNEKRPPLTALIISSRPNFIDGVIWGRVVMFIFSFGSLFLFDKLSSIYIKNEKYRNLSLLFFIFNPINLYWSIRIMTDIPFLFFVILVFYLLSRWKDINLTKSMLLGLLCGLSILTRFEGYILFASVLVGTVFFRVSISKSSISPKNFIRLLLENFKKVGIIGLTTLFLILPWLILDNPFQSEYFDEKSYMIFDFKVIWTYFSSLLYLLGFTLAFYIFYKNANNILSFFKDKSGLSVFIIVELIVILIWPAAVPRIFLPIIPFFIILLAISLQKFEEDSLKIGKLDIVILFSLVFFYSLTQYFLKLQFLVPSKYTFLLSVFIQLLTLLLLIKRKLRCFIIVSLFSSIIWSFNTIYIHKNVFSSMKYASDYVVTNLQGKVSYNGLNSLFDWYINRISLNKNLSGSYYAVSDSKDLSFERLSRQDFDYLIVTNETEHGMSFDFDKRKYLVLLEEFGYNVSDKYVFSKVFWIDKEFTE